MNSLILTLVTESWNNSLSDVDNLQGASVQCGLILLASLLFWAFRSQEESFGYTAY